MDNLVDDIRNCMICSEFLVHGPRPIFSVHPESKIVIIGQAPGSIVHATGIPWDDKSGENLRKWMKVPKARFYNPREIAILPMGFCYPGKGKSGDLPPRQECAPQWHNLIIEKMQDVKLTLLIGKYAQDYYLKERSKRTLTETVRNYVDYLPEYFVLPHPSPRNNIWQAKNEWFAKAVLPELQLRIQEVFK